MAEAATLPKVPLTDYDINWLQVIGEGWAAPLKGFMREGALVQQLWFNSMLVDEHNHTGMGGYLDGKPTNWMQVRWRYLDITPAHQLEAGGVGGVT